MKTGFLGVGNMGGAIARGVVKSGAVRASDVWLYDANPATLAQAAADTGANAAKSAIEMVRNSDVVVLCVKPVYLADAVAGIKEALDHKAVISIVAGYSSEKLRAILPESARYLRVMPNTPALVGAGVTALCEENTLTGEEYVFAETLFSAVGSSVRVPERLIEAVTGVSGSGPAYVFMFIEAMADGGVRLGLPRRDALELAARTVLGSAKMVLESGIHPEELKDMVCSPAGTTIEGVASLEKTGLRHSVMEAVTVVGEKALEMKNGK